MKSPCVVWKTPGWSRPAATALASLFLLAGPAVAAPLDGQVLGAGAPIANSTVTLWQAGSGAPRQLAQARSGADGRFVLAAPDAPLSRGFAVPGGPRRHAVGRQGQRRQPGHRAAERAGRQGAGQGDDQRDDDRRLGVDAQPVHRRRCHPGPAAAVEDRRRQRAQLRRPGHRRLGQHDPGPVEQQPDADDGQLRHAGQRAGRLRHAGAARGLPDRLPGRARPERWHAHRHADGRPTPSPARRGTSRTACSARSKPSTRCRRARRCARCPTCPTCSGCRAPGCCRSR